MESNIEEAFRAKAFAEKQFVEKDFVGARNYALKAQMLCPELEGISQMVATFGVYIASEAKINGERDFYAILGLDPSVERSKLKKQYKKLAVFLHPDKNRTVGADGAFRLISEAWTLLSDNSKRSSYDQRRNFFAGYCAGTGSYDNPSKFPPAHGRSDTFWTVCTSCHVQYEYLRKYVNKRLSCKNCRGVFIAVETGLAPVNSSFPYCTYSYMPENKCGYGGGVTYAPTYSSSNGATGHHSGYRSEYSSNISFQGTSSASSAGVLDPNGLSTSSFVFYQANGEVNQNKSNEKNHAAKVTNYTASNGYVGHSETLKRKRGRPSKKRKVELGNFYVNGHSEVIPNTVSEAQVTNANGVIKAASKLSSPSEVPVRRYTTAPAFDAKRLLIDKARSEICGKLEEMRLASEAAAAEAEKRKTDSLVVKVSGATGTGSQPELKRIVSMSITVPDSDFHDFDKDRTEECFKPKQIWALYDEEDGMPRLYCLIREVISLNPFKIFISYLSSKSDSEFGSVNWLDSGFTKSCGSFRVFHSETVDQVNIFSHLLSREKAGRGGCVRIYPRGGDIWAVYRNWSPDWDRSTPDEVRHRYEMVEVLEDYSEETGVWVAPLIKLDGFKTVYQRNPDKDSIRWIQRREMLRFSHQVPSCPLKVEGTNLPEGCWDLDPAATPDELLQVDTELQIDASPIPTEKTTESPVVLYPAATNEQPMENFHQSEIFTPVPDCAPQIESRQCMEERISVGLPQEQGRPPTELLQEEFQFLASAELPPSY